MAAFPAPVPAMYVCLCNGITERDIRQAATAGCRSMAELTMRTGCGAGCGSCIETASRLLEETVAEGEVARAA